MKKLIITADEFGLSPGTNRAVKETGEKGIVTNVAIIVTSQNFDDTVTWCLTHPAIGTGLFLDLDDFFFIDREKEYIKFYWGDIVPLNKIVLSIKHQIKIFQDTGLTCDFIASRYSVHLLPELFPYVCILCQENHIPGIRFNRSYYQTNFPDLPLSWIDQFIRQTGLVTTDHFINGWFYGNLDSYADGTAELSTRPGSFPPAREEELRICLNPEVKQYIATADIQLITFKHLMST